MNKAQKKEILGKLAAKLKEKGVGAAEVRALQASFTEVVKALNERLATQVLTKVETEVVVSNLADVVTDLRKNGMPITNLKDFPKELGVKLLEKPEWYKAPSDEVTIKNPEVTVKGIVKIEPQDQSGMMSFLADAFGALIGFLGKLATKTFTVTHEAGDYLKPQLVVLFDARTGTAVDLEKLFNVTSIVQPPSISLAAGGATAISFKGSSGITGGNLTIATAGTRQQLPNIPCRAVIIQADEGNSLLNASTSVAVVVGDSSVVAASGSRKGYAIYATQSETFNVANANMLYVDTTDNNAKLSYIILQ